MSQLHLIGNAHIDPVWLWPWSEGLAETLATFQSALDRMKEYPEFKFTASSAALYEWVEIVNPVLFKEIQARVAEGRWELTGGWWIEPDCNIPAGESFARQGLLGQSYFKRAFGRKAEAGYCVDSFGHNGMLPQILRKSGMENYVFMRPMPHEKDNLPGSVFWWEAPDGSRVLTLRLPFTYATWGEDLEDHIRACAEKIAAPLNEMACFYGVGNHGGGPTIANLEGIRRLSGKPDLPDLLLSTLEAFFAAARTQADQIPVYKGDLQHHAPGCYAAQSGIKRWNRQTENALLAAEKLAACAAWETGLAYPEGLLRGWKQLLFNQFHDILAGSSIESAYDEARSQLGEARSIAGRAASFALQSIAQAVDIPLETSVQPFIIFHPHAASARIPLEFEDHQLDGNELLLDSSGRSLPFQIIQSEAQAAWKRRLCVLADVPALGYEVYRIIRNPQTSTRPAIEGTLIASETVLQNDALRLEIDPASGCVSSLRDLREGGREMLAGLAARAVVHADSGDTWGHDIADFHNPIGAFQPVSVRLIEDGPVRAAIRVISTWNKSQLVQDFILYRGLDWVDLRVEIDWREQLELVKIEFPLAIADARATYEIPFGCIERPANGSEEAGQGWVDLSGQRVGTNQTIGLAVLNDGKYSFSALGNILEVTALRSPAYAHHNPNQLEPERRYSFIDNGMQRFTLRLMPHIGLPQPAELSRQAAELNQPCLIQQASFHPGRLAQRAAYVEAAPASVQVTAFKQAENGSDLILRACNFSDQPAAGILRMPRWNREIRAKFGPAEIKTFRIPASPDREVEETNLIEE